MNEKPESDPLAVVAELRIEVEKLIAGLSGPVREVRLRAGDCAVEVTWNRRPGVAHQESEAPPAVTAALPAAHVVTSPLVGTFYRASSPEQSPFVQAGDIVEPGQQIAIVEAMKLMNAITADRRARVTRVVAADGQMVEYGQVLIELEPIEEL